MFLPLPRRPSHYRTDPEIQDKHNTVTASKSSTMFQPYHLTIILTVSQRLCSKVVIINMEAGCSAFNHITVTVHAHSFTSQRYITFYQTYTYDHNKSKTGKTKTYQLFHLTPFDGPTDNDHTFYDEQQSHSWRWELGFKWSYWNLWHYPLSKQNQAITMSTPSVINGRAISGGLQWTLAQVKLSMLLIPPPSTNTHSQKITTPSTTLMTEPSWRPSMDLSSAKLSMVTESSWREKQVRWQQSSRSISSWWISWTSSKELTWGGQQMGQDHSLWQTLKVYYYSPYSVSDEFHNSVIWC